MRFKNAWKIRCKEIILRVQKVINHLILLLVYEIWDCFFPFLYICASFGGPFLQFLHSKFEGKRWLLQHKKLSHQSDNPSKWEVVSKMCTVKITYAALIFEVIELIKKIDQNGWKSVEIFLIIKNKIKLIAKK